MAKKKKKKLPQEAYGLFLLIGSVLLLFSLWSFELFHPKANWLGYVGYVAAFGLSALFGLGAYLLPIYGVFSSIKMLKRKEFFYADSIYFVILLSSVCLLLSTFAENFPLKALSFEGKVLSETTVLQEPYPRTAVRFYLGGVPFYYLFSDLPFLNLQKLLSSFGVALLSSSLAFISLILLSRFQLLRFFSFLFKVAKETLLLLQKMKKQKKAPVIKTSLPKRPIFDPPALEPKRKLSSFLQKKPEEKEPVQELKVSRKIQTLKKTKEPLALPTEALPLGANPSYQLPPPNLLEDSKNQLDQPTLKKELSEQAEVLEETLKSFGIEAKVGQINSGPTITSFEVHPSIGVKVQKIKALENDIALNMQAKSIRIVAPIPGKAAVGVEVPAIHPQEVNFKEMLLHYQARPKKFSLPILLGKAINGDWVFNDLAKMPHCLIAGATGSGKSVCINTLVMSFLMNARPEEVKLLMIDPKKVELTQYSKLPHMIAPVITEAHGAYAALQWLVKEMQLRYEILKQLGLRNITAFNHRKINKDLEESLSIPIPHHMPFIVTIIDEFADLMMVSSSDIETPIARIAQMARAVGIHLILATQRPSREVITGIIKANIPTRISFKVASRVNSQIILDDTGAESLLGNGDLLFLPPGSSQLLRAQGAYIRDEEINQVIERICDQSRTEYLIPSFDSFQSLDSGLGEKKGKDALYEQALTIVMASKSASTTFLQRKLKIGYARAASLIDELEENGIISSQEGSRPRRVLRSSGLEQEPLFEEELDGELS